MGYKWGLYAPDFCYFKGYYPLLELPESDLPIDNGWFAVEHAAKLLRDNGIPATTDHYDYYGDMCHHLCVSIDAVRGSFQGNDKSLRARLALAVGEFPRKQRMEYEESESREMLFLVGPVLDEYPRW